jgi:hypothetical protein
VTASGGGRLSKQAPFTIKPFKRPALVFPVITAKAGIHPACLLNFKARAKTFKSGAGLLVFMF